MKLRGGGVAGSDSTDEWEEAVELVGEVEAENGEADALRDIDGEVSPEGEGEGDNIGEEKEGQVTCEERELGTWNARRPPQSRPGSGGWWRGSPRVTAPAVSTIRAYFTAGGQRRVVRVADRGGERP
jgi:hypothetical protein